MQSQLRDIKGFTVAAQITITNLFLKSCLSVSNKRNKRLRKWKFHVYRWWKNFGLREYNHKRRMIWSSRIRHVTGSWIERLDLPDFKLIKIWTIWSRSSNHWHTEIVDTSYPKKCMFEFWNLKMLVVVTFSLFAFRRFLRCS
jgi:hypothetical protein